LANVRPPDNPPAGEAAGNGTVQIWDGDTGKALQTLQQAANVNPLTVRHVFLGSWSAFLMWNPANQKLALADQDGKVHVWDLSTNKTDPLVLRAHEEGVHSAAWSPDGNKLASVSGDGRIKIWGTASDKPIDTLSIQAADINPMRSYALTWAEEGKCLCVVSSEGEIQVVDVGSGKVIRSSRLVALSPMAQINIDRLGSHGERFIWSPDGKRLASIQNGDVVICWDPATGKGGASTTAPGADMMSRGMCSPAWDRS